MYHEARTKSGLLLCQVPILGSVPAVKRGVLESREPVVAIESEVKLVSSHPKMIVGGFEAGNLKPQRRQILERISKASTSFFRDTFGVIPRDTAYVHPNERLTRLFDGLFGQESFTIEDVFSIQRLQRKSNDDPTHLFPPLMQSDVEHYETTLEGIRDAMETRWSKFCEKAVDARHTPARSPIFQLWDPHTATYLAQMAIRLQYARREELKDLAEQLKPLLSDARRANPHARSKPTDTNNSKNKDPTNATQIPPATLDATTPAAQCEVWPTVFENSPLDLPQHLSQFWKSDLARAVIVSLALYASSTLSHPIPQGIAILISNFVLQPLGYQANPNGAQLLLTQLGFPVTDPLDIPYIVNLAPLDSEEANFPPLRPYPWLSSNDKISLESIAEGVLSAHQPECPSLNTISPRHGELSAASHLPASMCHRASSILSESPVLSSVENDEVYLQGLVTASKSPAFHFSRNVSSTQQHVPAVLNDSSTLLAHMDLDREDRVDLSGLRSYAIDDVSTTEVDDAFSLDIDPLLPYSDWILKHLVDYVSNTYANLPHVDHVLQPPKSLPKHARILIHIADPTAVMRVGDVLELGARERVETMYLPHRKSVMLPSILSEFYCSLQPSPHMNMALTFEAHLNILTGELEKMDVFPSKFKTMERLSYDRVQAALHDRDSTLADSDTSVLNLLHVFSKVRKIWRKKVGKAETMHIPKSHVSFDFSPSSLDSSKTSSTSSSSLPTSSLNTSMSTSIANGKPRIVISTESGLESARSLVEEMMILAGEITGRTAVDNGFTVPFRAQPFRTNLYIPSSTLQLELSGLSPYDPELPTHKAVLECEVTRKHLVHNLQSLHWMNQSETTAMPSEHRSLGLSLYSRASSPLRRYADIISHFQLKSWRRYGGNLQKLDFSPALIHSLSRHIDLVSKDIKYSQQQSERWWKNQYVLRHGMVEEWTALVFQAPDLSQFSISAQKNSPRPLLYSLFVLGLDIIVQLPTPVHLEVGQIVSLKPTALSEINLEWTVIPPSTQF